MKFLQIMLLTATCSFLAVNSSFAQTNWTQTSAPSTGWLSIASSADGKILVAVGPSVYVSTNSGTTWRLTSVPTRLWVSAASSADGTKLVVAGNTTGGAPILISTNSGTTWTTSSAPVLTWNSVASSADGSKLAAGYSAGLYTSADSGTTWVKQTNAPAVNLKSVASSADGNKLVAVISYGALIYNSTNAGVTWFSNSVPFGSWNSAASSADGTILVAVGAYNPIYVSTNSGKTWLPRFGHPYPSNPQWSSVRCSVDGKRIVAASDYFINYSMQASTDSGLTWSVANTINTQWNTLAASADGFELWVANTSTIYISQSTPTPQLNLIPTNNNLSLSWIVPSTNFVVQQNQDLSPGNWVTLTNTPVLNYSNLNYQLSLAPTNASGFFRLSTPP